MYLEKQESTGEGGQHMGRVKLLLAGESWITYPVHQKGFNAFTEGSYAEGEQLDKPCFILLVVLENFLEQFLCSLHVFHKGIYHQCLQQLFL
jgi:hypothetical protein